MAGYSRSEEKRQAFGQELGIPTTPDLETLLAKPHIQGVILTVPNEQHLAVAAEVAKALVIDVEHTLRFSLRRQLRIGDYGHAFCDSVRDVAHRAIYSRS